MNVIKNNLKYLNSKDKPFIFESPRVPVLCFLFVAQTFFSAHKKFEISND